MTISSPSPPPGSVNETRNVRIVVNEAAAARDDAVPGPFRADEFEDAYREISSWPDYRATPLVRLDTLAGSLGLGEIHYKDEGQRFGLSSFKPLGAAYAAARAVARILEERGESGVSPADLLAGRASDKVKDIALVCATDGNHGRAVAWGAQRLGAKAKVFTHDQMSPGRRAAIKALGGELTVCPGGYEDAVHQAFEAAAMDGSPVIQDTSTADYRDVPADITFGYGVIAREAAAALDRPPTHAIVQAGVGGVASAICDQFFRIYGEERPYFIVLEPTNAACVATSLAAGKRVTLTGDCHTAMAGLACGEVSQLAWEVLAKGADAALVADDQCAFDGMRRLADPLGDDPAIVAGECAGGTVGALMALKDLEDLRAALKLTNESRVFVLGTEGATDPEIYQRVVGRRPDEIVAGGS